MLEALRDHWPEYLIEAVALGVFMISACLFAVLLEHPGSPVHLSLAGATLFRRALMGLAMGLTAIGIIVSPWGQRSGAHMNPSVTLAFFALGKVKPWDAALYVLFQFAGGVAGVLAAKLLIGPPLGDSAIDYIVTVPGPAGAGVAFLAELAISMALMLTILLVSNSRRLSRFTPLFSGAMVAAFITVEAPLSGMSMNPARTLPGSAFHAKRNGRRCGSISPRPWRACCWQPRLTGRAAESKPFTAQSFTTTTANAAFSIAAMENSMPNNHYDVLIIGTGAGGATLASKLAPTGKKILLLERGDYVPREKDNWSSAAVNLQGKYNTKEVWKDKDGKDLHPHTNYNVGGNTKFYGAALFRLRKEDFGEIQHHGGVSPAWPLTYDSLEPYYAQAENQYHVHGERGEDPTGTARERPVSASSWCEPRATFCSNCGRRFYAAGAKTVSYAARASCWMRRRRIAANASRL